MALHWKLEYDRMDGDDEGWPSKKRDIEKQLIITNVLWGVTGALAVATLVVGLYTDFRKGKKDEEDSPEPGEVSLLVDPLGGGLALVGVF